MKYFFAFLKPLTTLIGSFDSMPDQYRYFDAVSSLGKSLLFGGFAMIGNDTDFIDFSLELTDSANYFNEAPHPFSDTNYGVGLFGPTALHSNAFDDFVVHSHHQRCVYEGQTEKMR